MMVHQEMPMDKGKLSMQHFLIKHWNTSKVSPVIFLLDNHSSHLSCKVLDLCKNSRVIMSSFPPHCSHKLQRLDLIVFGLFKKFSNIGAWLASNPFKSLTIFHLPAIVKHAFVNGPTSKNIISDFQSAGIFPFNQNIF